VQRKDDRSESTLGPVRGSRNGNRKQPENSLFFGIADGAPKWAEAPQRPEAGGKELVALQPKGERIDADPASSQVAGRSGGRWSRASKNGTTTKAEVSVPLAAKAPTPAGGEKSRPEICRSMLASVKPVLEESVVDYVVSLIEDDVSDDTRDTVFELLEGHDVPRNTMEVLWAGLTAS